VDDDPKVLIVCKPSGFAERSTRAQQTHEFAVKLVQDVLSELSRTAILWADINQGEDITDEITGYDLVVTVGGDGTLLYASHFVDDTPMLAINSAPNSSVGFFCGGEAGDFRELLANWRTLDRFQVSRMEVSIRADGGRRVLTRRGLNDALFCHANPAMTTRYSMYPEGSGRFGNKEFQMSSGVWFSTAVGSTAAIRSAGGFTMPHDNPNIQWLVREPYQPPGKRLQYVHGFLRPEEDVMIESRVKDGRVYVDGSHITESVGMGDRLVVRRSEEPLTLLNFRVEGRR